MILATHRQFYYVASACFIFVTIVTWMAQHEDVALMFQQPAELALQSPSAKEFVFVYVVHNMYEHSEVHDWVLRNILQPYPQAKIQIFCGTEVLQDLLDTPTVIQLIKSGRGEIYQLPVDNLSPFPRESMLFSIELWKRVSKEKAVVFTTNSVLCNNSRYRITDFLHFDYIGAPWEQPLQGHPAGNGWVSIRSRSKMIELLTKYPPRRDLIVREDVHAVVHMPKVGGRVAPLGDSSLFSTMMGRPETLFVTGIGDWLTTIPLETQTKCPNAQALLERDMVISADSQSYRPQSPPSEAEALANALQIPRRSEMPHYDLGVLLVQLTPVPVSKIMDVLDNFMANMDLTRWKFQIAAGKEMHAELRRADRISTMISSGLIDMFIVDVERKKYPEMYNFALFSPSFWEQVVAEKVILIHTDSVMCGRSAYKPEGFVKFDYVGAMWRHQPLGITVGNGGTSLRSRSKHLELLRRDKPKIMFPSMNEDVFFSARLPMVGGRVADMHSAGNFACEMDFNSRCMLLHGTHKYDHKAHDRILSYCPEAKFLLEP